jgi:adenosylmethionine-8-amino-7-oxononanoate aminotransferase
MRDHKYILETYAFNGGPVACNVEIKNISSSLEQNNIDKSLQNVGSTLYPRITPLLINSKINGKFGPMDALRSPLDVHNCYDV